MAKWHNSTTKELHPAGGCSFHATSSTIMSAQLPTHTHHDTAREG